MSIAAIAVQIDDYIASELLTKVERQVTHKLNGQRVIAVYVKNWCLDYLGDVGSVLR